MKNNADYIADYLSGELSPEEVKEFEARLASDKELNKEFQLFSKGMDYLKTRSMLEEIENDPDLPRIEKEVQAFLSEEREASEKEKTKSPGFRKALLRAMPAAILVAAFLIIRLFLVNDSGVQLYDKYYEALSGDEISSLIVRGNGEASLNAGINCYIKKDYQCVISKLKDDPKGAFYLGLSYLALEQYEEAQESLLLFQDTYPEFPYVNWYLGLSYLRMEKLDEARDCFERLSIMANPYSERAEKLIGKIEKKKAAS